MDIDGYLINSLIALPCLIPSNRFVSATNFGFFLRQEVPAEVVTDLVVVGLFHPTYVTRPSFDSFSAILEK